MAKFRKNLDCPARPRRPRSVRPNPTSIRTFSSSCTWSTRSASLRPSRALRGSSREVRNSFLLNILVFTFYSIKKTRKIEFSFKYSIFYLGKAILKSYCIFNIKKLILVDKLDRRSLDAFAARAYFYLAFACENLDAEARKSGQPSSNLVLNCRGWKMKFWSLGLRRLPIPEHETPPGDRSRSSRIAGHSHLHFAG